MSRNTTPPGVLLIDKPPGPTSHDIVAQVRRLLTTHYSLPTKVGHAGTLDPFASGLLVIAVGAATRLIDYTRDWPKGYEATAILGASSDTDDATGIITQLPQGPRPTRAELKNIVRHFTGEQLQTPPHYAALKFRGRPLYQYARHGQAEIAAAAAQSKKRHISIFSLTIREYEHPRLSLALTCSGGTYVRALIRDLGQALHTGAYVAALRRTSVGTFGVEKSIKVSELTTSEIAEHLLPPEVLIAQLPRCILPAASVAQFRQGQTVEQGSIVPAAQPIAVFDETSNLVAIGQAGPAPNLLSPRQIL